MEKEHRKSKKSKKNKKSKRRRRTELEDFEFSDEEALLEQAGRSAAPLVEYSDVSSEDFSGPEAGEIETDPDEGGGLSPISPEDTIKDSSPSSAAVLRGTTTTKNTNNRSRLRKFDLTRLGPVIEEVPIRMPMSPKTTTIVDAPSRLERRDRRDSGAYMETTSNARVKTETNMETIESEEAESVDSASLRKYKKKKKKEHKKHKKAKKRKKKRAKSVSSAETISEEEDPILAGEPMTPKHEPHYTPLREPSLAPFSPVTPPPRPASPPYTSPSVSAKRREYAPSPHTPPMPKVHRHYEGDSYHDSSRYRKHHTPGNYPLPTYPIPKFIRIVSFRT